MFGFEWNLVEPYLRIIYDSSGDLLSECFINDLDVGRKETFFKLLLRNEE